MLLVTFCFIFIYLLFLKVSRPDRISQQGPLQIAGAKQLVGVRKLWRTGMIRSSLLILLVHTLFLFWEVVAVSVRHALKVTRETFQIFKSPWLSPVHLVTKSWG